MRRNLGITAGLTCIALMASAKIALAQATRPAAVAPAPADPYKDVPLAAPRANPAATQSSLASTKSPPSDPLETSKVVMALGAVLLAMYIVHRVWRRLGMPGSTNKTGQTLQIISRLALSPRQQILLIRVGRRCVLVGNSGAQMNPLCEISDAEEAAALLGQTITESKESVTATFGDVLDGAQQQFDAESSPKPQSDSPEEDPALAAARDQITNMVDKVRSLSKQFQQRPS
jgi:flagellar biogenesis protein FliO